MTPPQKRVQSIECLSLRLVTGDATECPFRGTYLEVESVEMYESDGVTKVKMNLAFREQAGRVHMTKTGGQKDSWDKMEDYLRSLVDPNSLELDQDSLGLRPWT